MSTPPEDCLKKISILNNKKQKTTDPQKNETSHAKHKEILQRQLLFSRALNHISEIIVKNDDAQSILRQMAEITGKTIGVDRCLIYNTDFKKHLAIGMCEWLNSDVHGITATQNMYNLDIFIGGARFMLDNRRYLESHSEDVNPNLTGDGSAEILHGQMNIKSMLWHPFSFHNDGFYCLVLNQITRRRYWAEDEIEFISAASRLVEIALQKISYIIENKQALKRLRESEERYRQLVELSPDVIVVHSEGKIVFINKASARLYGVKNPGEILGKPILDFVHPDYRELVKLRMEQMLETKKGVPVIEEKFVKLDGSVIDMEVSAAPLTFEGKPAIQVVIRDITKRKQSDTALRMSEERFSKAFKLSPSLMSINKLSDGRYTDANESFLRVTGYRRSEIVGRTPMELNLWVNLKDMFRLVKELRRHNRVRNMESRFRVKSGDIYVGLLSAELIELNGEECILTAITDITYRKMLEQKLQESENLYRQLVELSPDAVVVHIGGRIVYTNKTAAKRYGVESSDFLIGKPVTDFIHPDYRDMVEKRLRNTLEQRKFLPLTEIKLLKPDGSSIDVEISAVISTFGGKSAIQSVIRDITQRKDIEREMARLERLNLIGEMAASIGHEIRNPMTTVRGLLQILQDKKECVPYKEYFGMMVQEMDRANSIITEFLSLAKNKPVNLKAQSLNQILKNISPLITADALNSNKFITVEFGEIPDIALDDKEIRQLVLNLVRNGLEATPDGGLLTIKTFADTGYVILSIKDTGQGIKPEVLEKIGTPFFTTKDNGTGLGLAVCYSIASRHNAAIKTETGPNGTTFFVRFETMH